jgi:hypothetical protein
MRKAADMLRIPKSSPTRPAPGDRDLNRGVASVADGHSVHQRQLQGEEAGDDRNRRCGALLLRRRERNWEEEGRR